MALRATPKEASLQATCDRYVEERLSSWSIASCSRMLCSQLAGMVPIGRLVLMRLQQGSHGLLHCVMTRLGVCHPGRPLLDRSECSSVAGMQAVIYVVVALYACSSGQAAARVLLRRHRDLLHAAFSLNLKPANQRQFFMQQETLSSSTCAVEITTSGCCL